jgi:hypothetical protein
VEGKSPSTILKEWEMPGVLFVVHFFAIEQMLTMLIWIILTIHIPCDHKGSSTGDLGIWEPPKWRVTHVEVENMDQ